MQVKTNVKGGILTLNHNETLVRSAVPACPGLKVKTSVKAGGLEINHNQKQIRVARKF
jgi:hypothetical protein